jgi:hypothetical protein
VITSPLVNAAANLCLKAVDLTLKFSLAPHSNKTAYFDDILAQALNVLQVGVLFKLVKDKADGLVKGEGLGGDQAGVFFVGGALAAIGPALFTAMYECFSKLIVLYRKLLLAQAKIKDRVKALENARKNPYDIHGVGKTLLSKALIKAFRMGIENVNPEPDAAPNSVAGVQLTPAEMQGYVEIMVELLTRDDGLAFKAAKEMKNQYLKNLNTAEAHPLKNITCLLKALQTVMNNPSYKTALEMGGKDLLFRLLQLPAGLDLNKDLDAVESRLNSESFIENIDRFRKVMQMCSDFDPEKAKEYFRKAKLVLFELQYTQEPLEYTQEPLKNYVMGDPAQGTPDGAGDKEESLELKKIRIRIRGENKDPEYVIVDPGDKIKISRAPVRYGTDFSEMYLGHYVPKPLGAVFYFYFFRPTCRNTRPTCWNTRPESDILRYTVNHRQCVCVCIRITYIHTYIHTYIDGGLFRRQKWSVEL